MCVEAYAEQAQALAEGGVDLLVLETFFAVEEALWAIEGVQSVTDLPLVVSFSFDQGTHTMMGLSPTDVVAAVDASRRRGARRELRPFARRYGRRRGRVPRRCAGAFRSG